MSVLKKIRKKNIGYNRDAYSIFLWGGNLYGRAADRAITHSGFSKR